ncbi:MAG: class I SAM-dependent methyltransferase [bacterium]|nr:class I SAM-dependent methyltransferase [bacterium]
MDFNEKYYSLPAAAFTRSALLEKAVLGRDDPLFTKDPASLSPEEINALLDLALKHDLKLKPFKRNAGLPRVQKVLGILKGLAPKSMLDIGSGRGVFLWPLLEELPMPRITCVDTLDYRVRAINHAAAGGIDRVRAVQMDACSLDFPDRHFDVVTMLEVLEHIEEAEKALAEVFRVARKYVLLSVPSKEDSNPEHIHLFTRASMEKLLAHCAPGKARFDFVLNHMIVLIKK